MAISKKCVDELTFARISKPSQESYTFRWAGASTDWHRHTDFYEISLFTNGSYTHTHNDISETLEKGTLSIFNIGELHHLYSPVSLGSTHFTLCLTKSYFRLLGQLFSIDFHLLDKAKYQSVQLTDTTYQYLLALSNMLLQELHDEEKVVKLFFHNAMHALAKSNMDSTSPHRDFVDDMVEKICNYTYLTLSTQEIYSHYPYSIPTIIKRFKDRTGMTVSQYQAKIRLEYAARLLRETNDTIESIVANIGLLSTGHFFEIFKEHYGVSPNVYRKHKREKVVNTDF